ncbi:hypothetical protein RJT34_25257 [Clitoria ternatea]|uniref:Ubiquitin-like domain-containing protein n=1 Tax=Clitoria ternatea TaxID=43366 RepID=A0AAN9IJV5_CLITE
MEIVVDIVPGVACGIPIHPFETVFDVKRKIEQECLIAFRQQHLFLNGQLLQDFEIIPLLPNFVNGARFQLLVTPRETAPSAPQPQPLLQPYIPPPPQVQQLRPQGQQLRPQVQQLRPQVPQLRPQVQQLRPQVQQLPPLPTNERINSSPPKQALDDFLLACSLQRSPQFLLPSNSVFIPPAPSLSPRVVARVKLPMVDDRIGIEIDVGDTVKKLKEKILEHAEMKDVVLERMALVSHDTRVVLLEGRVLRDCGVSSDCAEIDVVIVNLRVNVLPMGSNENIEVDVYDEDNVVVLREKLHVWRSMREFPLPEDGRYFFVHNQNVMQENKSFKLHRVQQGDTILTFDGIAPGSS